MEERKNQASGAYGGLSARGLDFGEGEETNQEDIANSFSK